MKMIRLKVITTNILLERIAKIYRDKIWKLHGVLRIILSDQGPQFMSKFMKEFTKVLETKRKLSTTYHSQTNRQTERNWLATVEFLYNDKKYMATEKMPFELNFGRHP